MAQFHQHPDGHIYVRTNEGIYRETPANFAIDYAKKLPALPPGVVERIYDDEGRHAFIDAKGNHVDSGPMPFPFGDAAIAAAAALHAKKKAREDAAMPVFSPPMAKPPLPGGKPNVIA